MRLFSCVNDIVLVSLLLNLNIFHALFCFHCWLRTGWINLVVKQFSWKVSTGRKLGPYFCHIYLPNLKNVLGSTEKNLRPFCCSGLKTEAVAQMCSVKKLFLEVLQNSQENNCARVSFLIKLQAWGTFIFLWILRNFSEHFFYRTPPVAVSEQRGSVAFTVNHFFYSVWVFFQKHSRIAGLHGKGDGIS